MYTGPKLLDLLASKHQQQNTAGLYKQDTFILDWRAKVGSFPHPDLETLISAGEPCGAWKLSQGRPEYKRNVGENLRLLPVLPLNGYIPGSSIRGIVRAWAKKRPEVKLRMDELLGNQVDDRITSGKIEFLDAWPRRACKLSLDVVNPQENFQVFHDGESQPVSSYTLGNGKDPINFTVAIRGIPSKATPEEVEEVWSWVQQALCLYGVGSRTASGYGTLQNNNITDPEIDPDYEVKSLKFTLYSQGSAGPDMAARELRPAHWRGWLRSWLLRFFLGVMNENDAKKTVGELLGAIGTNESEINKGIVKLQINKGLTWAEESSNTPYFYAWTGSLKIIAPSIILNEIILPIVKFACSIGGVGRGWRRPLHIFKKPDAAPRARGTYFLLQEEILNQDTQTSKTIPYTLNISLKIWEYTYKRWRQVVSQKWPKRINLNANINLPAEVFSPDTCAVYLVPGPVKDPLLRPENQKPSWAYTNSVKTRGEGMNLIYQDTYKNKIEVGGRAGGGRPYCSWVSIKRIKVPNQEKNTDFSEIVCIFKGGNKQLRNQFRQELAQIPGAVKLFGN